jgi:hypothetical protein
MTKFTVRPYKTVYYPVNIEVEANTFEEAAILGLAELHRIHPNWLDGIHQHSVIDCAVDRHVSKDTMKGTTKRRLTLNGRKKARS